MKILKYFFDRIKLPMPSITTFTCAYMWQNYISMNKHSGKMLFSHSKSHLFVLFCSTNSVKQKKISKKKLSRSFTIVTAMIMVSGYSGFFDSSWNFVIEKCDEIWGYVNGLFMFYVMEKIAFNLLSVATN